MLIKLRSPIPGARITSPYGDRIHPITKKKTFHNGVDFGVAVGTKIEAPHPGRVAKRWYDDRGGHQMLLVGPWGSGTIQTGYAHMQAPGLAPGTEVVAGEELGRTGNTGASTGPHLHFTVRIDGVLVDPKLYL